MRITVCALLSFAFALIATTPAWAHDGATRFIEAQAEGDGVRLEVRGHASDAAVELEGDLSEDVLADRGDEVAAWLVDGIEVWADEPCDVTSGAPRLQNEFVVIDLTAHCQAGDLTVLDSKVGDGHRTMVTVVDASGEKSTTALNGASESVAVSRSVSALQAAGTFLVQGALHLLTGYDHLLFLLSLLFAAGLVAREHGTKKALRSVGWIITAFTLGHSITLIVASLGLVSLPSRWVEATIAASIIVVAGMNIFRPEATMDRAWIAFGFGLVHGFGFSSVLADVGLPAQQRAAALFAFNVGIELAQLACVALVLAPLAWLAQKKFYRRGVMQFGSLAIAVCAAYWLFERVFA